jgi:quinol monooxygenase YgiN
MFNVMTVVKKNGNKLTLELVEPASISKEVSTFLPSQWEDIQEISFHLKTEEKDTCVATWILYK